MLGVEPQTLQKEPFARGLFLFDTNLRLCYIRSIMTVKEIIETARTTEAMRKHIATGGSLRTFTIHSKRSTNEYNS